MEVVELLARAGFDFIVVDMEHSPLNVESAYRLTVAAQACDMTALIRVPDRSGSLVQRLLDSGADGLVVPQVTSVEQARGCLDQMIFSPAGVRGMGITSRVGGWGLDGRPSYLESGDDVVRVLQLEDLESLQNWNHFLDLEGLGALFVGLGDLTLSSGLAPNDPAIAEPIEALLAEATKRGIPVGTAVGNAAAARGAAARGFSFVMVSNDASILGQAATAIVSEASGNADS
jgi:2-dehydro-3-deoxyglucarate aldolase/4-hydroxy-2-oxoheptanedioate aldolase